MFTTVRYNYCRQCTLCLLQQYKRNTVNIQLPGLIIQVPYRSNCSTILDFFISSLKNWPLWRGYFWEQLQNTGPYFKVLNRSGSVAPQSRQVFKERERYKTYQHKTEIEGIYFSMYYSRLQVYILVARRLGGSSVEVIQFSGSTARWLVSRDYRATEPPQ